MGQGVGGYCEHLPYYKVVDPDAEHIRQYIKSRERYINNLIKIIEGED